jgi:hypothetical protein
MASPRVEVDKPESMNLLGLLMKGLLQDNLAVEANARRAEGLRGDVQVQAAGMIVTLRFGPGVVSILAGAAGPARARVRGGMEDLLGMVTGAGLIGPVLAGRVRVGGNLLLLLRMLPLIKAPM